MTRKNKPEVWRAHSFSHGLIDIPISADDGEGKTIARVMGHDVLGPELIRRARLLAAAPELLALVELVADGNTEQSRLETLANELLEKVTTL